MGYTIAMEKKVLFQLPKDFLLGTATAATQIEGGDTNNSWYDWSIDKNHIADGSNTLLANDHWNRYKEDIDLMAQMGMQIYRMGLEWSRIEPEEGNFNVDAINHYREEISYIQSKGIKVLVTLHHFSNPLWFEKIGAFENKNSHIYFEKYVSYTVSALKDIVDEWVTINEANIYAVNGYFFGIWPPGKKSFFALRKVYTNLATSHLIAYKTIHKLYKDHDSVKVGCAQHLILFEPLNSKNPFHVFMRNRIRNYFQRRITDAMLKGVFKFPLKKKSTFLRNRYEIESGKYYDFIGINYYMRTAVSAFGYKPHKETPKNDLGWEIWPAGMIELASELHSKYKAPIYITENGTCDKNDSFRAKFIYDHLKAISESGLPIERYYHWTFIDNFEWAEGQSAPFGLVELNFETQKRTIRPSGNFYSEIIKNRCVSVELCEKYKIQLL